MLRIAVQTKGRLHEETMRMLEESGIKLESTKRLLLLQSKDFPVEVLFLRDDDIPQAVATGIADAGVIGENEYVEKNEDAEIVKRLNFSKCRLSLAIPKAEEYPGLQWFEGKRIATSYPHILKKFLDEKGIRADIHIITGSVEIAPGINLADCIFDIVSSGSTLVSNNLKEVEVVMKSEALMICNKNLSDEKRAILNELLFRFSSYKNAEGKKYIILNVPNDKIPDVCKLLPGMKSPTVTPLVQEGWSSLQSVISEDKFWDIISKLKALGVSSFTPKVFSEFVKSCEILPAVNQCETHIYYQQRELIEVMKPYKTILESWSPFVAGKSGFFDNPTLAQIAQKHNKSVAQVALRFLVQQGIVAIPKTSKLKHMQENIAIFDFALSAADMETIRALDTNKTQFSWGY